MGIGKQWHLVRFLLANLRLGLTLRPTKALHYRRYFRDRHEVRLGTL